MYLTNFFYTPANKVYKGVYRNCSVCRFALLKVCAAKYFHSFYPRSGASEAFRYCHVIYQLSYPGSYVSPHEMSDIKLTVCLFCAINELHVDQY